MKKNVFMSLSFIVLMVVASIAYATITANSPIRSSQSGSIGNSTMVDSLSHRLPVLAVVQPDSSGVTGLNSTYFVSGKYSPVTGLEEPPQYKLANGKTVPVWALAKLDPSARTIIPFVAAGGGTLSSLNGQSGATQVFANDTNVTITSSSNTHQLGWAGTLSVSRGGTSAALAPVLGGVVYTDATKLNVLAAGTSGQVLGSNGAAAPTWVSFPAAPSGTICGWSDSTGPTLIVACQTHDPNVDCPAGYTQKTTTGAKFCAAN